MMEWNEIIALSYLVSIPIVFLFLTLRSVITNVRNNGRNTISKNVTSESNDNRCHDSPKPNGVLVCEITDLNERPNKEGAPNYDKRINPFRLHVNSIIGKDDTKCK